MGFEKVSIRRLGRISLQTSMAVSGKVETLEIIQDEAEWQ
jgi:hypothetical protein